MADYQPLYESAGTDSNLDPLFLRAQAIVESHEKPNAVSPAGASGISQFMPTTAATAGLNGTPIDPMKPEQAIPAQARMMDGLITKHKGDVNAALTEYVGGTDRSKWGPQTAAYPGKVAAAYTTLLNAKAQAMPTPTPTSDFDARLSGSMPAVPAAPAATTESPTPYFDARLAGPPTGGGTQAFGPEPPNRPSDEPGITPYDKPTPPAPSLLNRLQQPLDSDAIYDAAMEGYHNTNLLTPAGQIIADAHTGPVGWAVTHGANGLLGIGGGIYRGVQEEVNQFGNALSPGLGRDLAAGQDILPAVAAEARFGTINTVPLSNKFQAQPFSKLYNPDAVMEKGDSSPNYFKPPVPPTANPAAPATIGFAKLLTDHLSPDALLGYFIDGGTGAVLTPIIANLARQYGPVVARAVVANIKETVRREPTAALSAIGSQTQSSNPLTTATP